MKVFRKILVLITIVLSFFILVSNVNADENLNDSISCTATLDDEFTDDRVLVVLNKTYSLSSKEYTKLDFPEIDCVAVENLTQVATDAVINGIENNLVNKEKYQRVLSIELRKKSKENVLKAINILTKREDVDYAGPNYIMEMSSTTPNDPYINEQWAIDDIHLPETWDCYKGSNLIKVGILDTGIDGGHPDLSSKIIFELCRDFTSGREVVGESLSDPTGHGTHVAGIIGAAGNNALGITGVNWNVGLVSLRVSNEEKKSSTGNIGLAVNFAQKNNIPILNFSSSFSQKPVDLGIDAAFRSIIDDYNGLFVNSAGNDGIDIDGDLTSYPAKCTCENLIVVGAYNRNNERCSFSNFGTTSVDVFAPGEDILSTYIYYVCEEFDYEFQDGTRLCEIPLAYAKFFQAVVEENDFTWEFFDENFSDILHYFFDIDESVVYPRDYAASTHSSVGYHYMNGTSMAAPYVAGIAALLLSANPNLTAIELKNKIIEGATDLSVKTSNNTSQTVKKVNAFYSLNLVHTHQFSYTSTGTKHIASCFCDYQETQSHNYNSYEWLNGKNHNAICYCGGISIRGHVVASGSYGNGNLFATCLLCGGTAEIGFVFLNTLSDGIQYITLNGSFVLPNGVIVLEDEDFDSYMNGTLVFYDKNSNFVTS